MNINVEITGEKKKIITIPSSSTVSDVLELMSMKPDMWLAEVDGAIIPIDTKLAAGDRLKLLRITSGG